MNFPFLHYLGTGRSFLYVFVAILYSIFSVVNYVALFPLVGIALSGRDQFYSEIVQKKMPVLAHPFVEQNVLEVFAGSVLLIYLFKFSIGIYFSVLAGQFGELYMCHLRGLLVRRFEEQSFTRTNSDKADYAYEFNLVSKVGSLNWAFINFNIKAATALFAFVTLISLFPKLVLIVAAFSVIWTLVLLPILAVTRRESIRYLGSQRMLNRFMFEHLNSIEIIRVFEMEGLRNARKNELSTEAIRSNIWMSGARQAAGSVQEVLMVGLILIVLYFSSVLTMSATALITFGYVFSKFLGNLNEASGFLSTGLEIVPLVSELRDRGVVGFDSTESKLAKSSPAPSGRAQSFRLKNFTVYSRGTKLVADANFEARLGDKIQIVGPNGVGKSSLLKAILGLLPAQGSILINGRPLEEGIGTNMKFFSYLPQGDAFFDGTIFQNITMFDDSRMPRLQELLRELSLDLSTYFQAGGETVLQDNASSLSGGQRQIVSLLRALVKDAGVLVMDEFTNHLSEDLVRRVSRHLASRDDQIIILTSHSSLDFVNRQLTLTNQALYEHS